MLNKIGRILFGSKIDLNKVDKSSVELFNGSTKSAFAPNLSAVNEFLSSIKEIGHPEYPILDRLYSPGSRVPCTDLVPFISNRLLENDINSIIDIMRLVIEGNPGVGVGTGWIEDSIRNILSIPFEDYVSFKSSIGLIELESLFIVASKAGGARPFMTITEFPRLFSWNSIIHQPIWSVKLQSLAKKANLWISKMAEEYPETIWPKYEKFDVIEYSNRFIEIEMQEKIKVLTPAARLQLFYAVEKGGGVLYSMTNGLTSGPIRSLGININNTSQELLSSNLIIPSSSHKAIESGHSKQELIEYCESYDVSYKKSWKKEQLVEAIAKKDSEILSQISHTKNIVAPNFQTYPELNNIVHIADEHEIGFKLLCFTM